MGGGGGGGGGRRDWTYCRFEMSCAASFLWPHLPINPLGADGDNDKMCQYASQVVKGCHMTQSTNAHHVHTGPHALAWPVRRPHQNGIFFVGVLQL